MPKDDQYSIGKSGYVVFYEGAISDLLEMRDIYNNGNLKDRAANLAEIMKNRIPSKKDSIIKYTAWNNIMESLNKVALFNDKLDSVSEYLNTLTNPVNKGDKEILYDAEKNIEKIVPDVIDVFMDKSGEEVDRYKELSMRSLTEDIDEYNAADEYTDYFNESSLIKMAQEILCEFEKLQSLAIKFDCLQNKYRTEKTVINATERTKERRTNIKTSYGEILHNNNIEKPIAFYTLLYDKSKADEECDKVQKKLLAEKNDLTEIDVKYDRYYDRDGNLKDHYANIVKKGLNEYEEEHQKNVKELEEAQKAVTASEEDKKTFLQYLKDIEELEKDKEVPDVFSEATDFSKYLGSLPEFIPDVHKESVPSEQIDAMKEGIQKALDAYSKKNGQIEEKFGQKGIGQYGDLYRGFCYSKEYPQRAEILINIMKSIQDSYDLDPAKFSLSTLKTKLTLMKNKDMTLSVLEVMVRQMLQICPSILRDVNLDEKYLERCNWAKQEFEKTLNSDHYVYNCFRAIRELREHKKQLKVKKEEFAGKLNSYISNVTEITGMKRVDVEAILQLMEETDPAVKESITVVSECSQFLFIKSIESKGAKAVIEQKKAEYEKKQDDEIRQKSLALTENLEKYIDKCNIPRLKKVLGNILTLIKKDSGIDNKEPLPIDREALKKHYDNLVTIIPAFKIKMGSDIKKAEENISDYDIQIAMLERQMALYNPEKKKLELEKPYSEWKKKHDITVSNIEYYRKQYDKEDFERLGKEKIVDDIRSLYERSHYETVLDTYGDERKRLQRDLKCDMFLERLQTQFAPLQKREMANKKKDHEDSAQFSEMCRELDRLCQLDRNTDPLVAKSVLTELKQKASDYIQAKESQYFHWFPSKMRKYRLDFARQLVSIAGHNLKLMQNEKLFSTSDDDSIKDFLENDNKNGEEKQNKREKEKSKRFNNDKLYEKQRKEGKYEPPRDREIEDFVDKLNAEHDECKKLYEKKRKKQEERDADRERAVEEEIKEKRKKVLDQGFERQLKNDGWVIAEKDQLQPQLQQPQLKEKNKNTIPL